MEKKKLVRVPPDIGGCPWILGKIEAAVENGYQVLVENCGLMEWWDGQVLSGFLNGLWGKRWFHGDFRIFLGCEVGGEGEEFRFVL